MDRIWAAAPQGNCSGIGEILCNNWLDCTLDDCTVLRVCHVTGMVTHYHVCVVRAGWAQRQLCSLIATTYIRIGQGCYTDLQLYAKTQRLV